MLLAAVYNYADLIVITIRWLHPSLSCCVSLSPFQSCCCGCFNMNVTMTPPILIRKIVPSCSGFWEHEPATAASDMPDFPLSTQSGFSYTLPFFSLTFSFTLIFCSFFFFFKYLLCAPVAPAPICFLFFYPPSLTPPPLSVLQGVGFSGSESCFAFKNSLS